jgi:hypothetical protein
MKTITVIRSYSDSKIRVVNLHPTKEAAIKQLKMDGWWDSPDYAYSVRKLTPKLLATYSKEILEAAE